ncbi:MAG TPA: alpha/beta hydrolase [Draconibacterium sp.]|nr:alpha/beta hydrolase [Draconibacterium sp.]
MNKILISIVILLITSMSSFSQIGIKVAGNWSGKLDLPGTKLEIIFKIAADENGKLNAKMDVPAQGAKDLPVSETIVNGDSLKLSVVMIMGKFAGKITSDSIIEGTWKQSGATFPLILRKTGVVTEMKRPQTPQAPFPYLSEEVEYINPKSGLKLAGTLTLPENARNCSAVILISGSGAQDRDETIFGHKPFFVIADFLTRNGIAVLRVDDRGVGGSEGNAQNATSEDFAGDILAGLEFLKTKKEIDHRKIGLIGHSEGGIIAPMVANRSGDIAFIVLLAGPGIKGEQIVYKQVELLNRAAGLTEEQVTQKLHLQKKIFDILLNEKDTVNQMERLQQAFSNGTYATMSDDGKKIVDTNLNVLKTRWFQFFLTYDPYPALVKLECPVLALNGGKDLQVPPKENLNAIEKALKEGGNKNFKTVEIENLNHLFQTCGTGAVAEYAQIEETISPAVLEILRDWIKNLVIKN